MHTPTTRVLELGPHERLNAIITIYSTRWSAPTIAAAFALPNEEVTSLTPVAWVHLLDTLEVALTPVIRRLDPLSEPRIRCH